MDTQQLAHVRCLMLDMDGTIFLGNQLLPGALQLFDLVRERGLEYLILTNNSSRQPAYYADKLHRLGLDVPEDRIFTSGEATATYLCQHMPGARVYVVGTPGLEDTFRAAGFTLDEERPDVAVLGFDTTLTYDKLWRLCDLVRAGLPYI